MPEVLSGGGGPAGHPTGGLLSAALDRLLRGDRLQPHRLAVADSLSLRRFLGYDLQAGTPDHSSLSRIRGRLDPGTHNQVFRMVLLALREAGLSRVRPSGWTPPRWRPTPPCVRSCGGIRGRVIRIIWSNWPKTRGSSIPRGRICQAGQEPQEQGLQRRLGASA